MPTDNMRTIQIKILTYGIYILMFVLSTLQAWQLIQFSELPNNYVRLERYKDDRIIYRTSLKRIESKIDIIITDHMRK